MWKKSRVDPQDDVTGELLQEVMLVDQPKDGQTEQVPTQKAGRQVIVV
jgi:hypothetical protein